MNNNQVMAKVGNKEITRNDVEQLMKGLDPQTAAQFCTEEGLKQLIVQLANQELFYLDAIEKGMDKEEAYIQEIEKLKPSLLKQYAINKHLSTASVSEDEAHDYYNQNNSHFIEPESVKASHILVQTKDEAQKIISEINEGCSFEDAANKYSSCPSKSQGGDLGFFPKGKMVPEFEEVVFSMNKGEIVKEPVKTQYGYHIIKLTDKKDSHIKPFDDVREFINQQLLTRKQETLFFGKVEELKNSYEIKMFI